MPDPQPSPAPQDAPPPEPQKDPLEARIEELLGAQQALTQKVQTQESLGDELRALFTGLTQKIDALSGGRLEPTRQPQPPTVPGAPQAADLQRLVQDAVAQALTPLTEGAARTERHKQGYARVSQQYPAFADPASKAAQIFNKIYTTRADLRGLDDAPVVIAGLVRDILASERAAQQADTERRTLASIPPSSGRKVPVNVGTDADVQQLKNRFLQLHEKGTKLPLSLNEQGDYLNLQVALKSLGVL